MKVSALVVSFPYERVPQAHAPSEGEELIHLIFPLSYSEGLSCSSMMYSYHDTIFSSWRESYDQTQTTIH
jgi:hypothetical protein